MRTTAILIICLSILIPLHIAGQDQLSRKFSPEQLKEDLRYFIQTAESIHPNLYHSVSREEINAHRLELESQITDSMNALEFGRLVIPLSTRFSDGHTSLWFPYNEAAKAYSKEARFPFTVAIIGRQVFIAKNYSKESALEVWDEILEINGQSASDLLDELLLYKNGELESFRLRSIENMFSFFLWLVKGWGTQFDLVLKRGEQEFHQTLKGLLPGELKKTGITGPSPANYSFSMINAETGLLDFRSMVNSKNFKHFLDSTFQLLQEHEAKNLIIDIRNNGGGNSRLGDLLFDYITDQSYKQVDQVIIKTSSVSKSFVKSRLKWYMYPLYPLVWVNKQAKASLGKKDGSLTEIQGSESKVHQHKKNRFEGKVYLLIGPGTFSSANMLAAAFSCYQMGTVIGEESGEPLISYGELIYFKLPNTRADAWSSSKSFFLACSDPNRPNQGVLPDYEVIPKLEDRMKDQDAVLQYTLNLIKTNNQ